MNQEQDFTLYVKKLRSRWPLLAGLTVFFASAALVYTLVSAPEWEARGSLLVAMNDNPRASTPAPGGLASLGQTATPLGMLKGVAVSRRVEEDILKAAPMEAKTLRRIYGVTDLVKENQIILAAKSKNKETALTIVRTAIESMETISREIGFSNAQRQVKYLEAAIAAREKEFVAAQTRLASFQRSMKAPEPGAVGEYKKRLGEAELEFNALEKQANQLRSTARRAANKSTSAPTAVPAVAEWRKRLVEQEYQLRIAETTLGPENPRLEELRQQVRITRDTLTKEVARYLTTIDATIDPTLAEVEGKKVIVQEQIKVFRELAEVAPDEAKAFSKLVYEAQMLQAALTQLRTAYEQARTDAEVDRVRFSVLDRPTIDAEPTNKNFGRNGALGAVLGIILGALTIALLPLKGAKGG